MHPSAKPVPRVATWGKSSSTKAAKGSGGIRVLHGPKLNLLGTREPSVYGRDKLSEINARWVREGTRRGVSVDAFQSNQEAAMIDRIRAARDHGMRFVVINRLSE